MNDGSILMIASAESDFARLLGDTLNGCQPSLIRCSSLQEAHAILKKSTVQMVLCEDRVLLGRIGDLIRILSNSCISVPVILFSHVLVPPSYLQGFESEEEGSPASPAKRGNNKKKL